MSYKIQDIIDFFKIDTEWGWFAPLAIPFFCWYLLVQSLLTVEFGIIGQVIAPSERGKAVQTIGNFQDRLMQADPHSKSLIFSLSEDQDGTAHHRITARLSDSNWTYKFKPWLLMVFTSLLPLPVGMTLVGALGFKKGNHCPKWLVNSLVAVNLIMLIVVFIVIGKYFA